MFKVVLDYGEPDAGARKPGNAKPWLCRHDPFSSYRSGFEDRGYRLCQRVLMFHHSLDEPGVSQECLARSTDFLYSNLRENPDDPRKGLPVASFVATITQDGSKRESAGGYLKKSLPPLEFECSDALVNEALQELGNEGLENLPSGLDGAVYQEKGKEK